MNNPQLEELGGKIASNIESAINELTLIAELKTEADEVLRVQVNLTRQMLLLAMEAYAEGWHNAVYAGRGDSTEGS